MSLCFLLTFLDVFFLSFYPCGNLIKLPPHYQFFYIVEDALLQLLILHLFLILTLQGFIFSPSLSPLGLSSGPVCFLACTLPFSMNSILFTSNGQFSEVRLDSNHLEKDKKYIFRSWGTSEKREEKMGL